MACIEKRVSVRTGKVSYRAIVKVKGRKNQTKTFTRKTDATAWASNLEYELREQPHLTNSEASKRTLAGAIDKYVDTVLPEKALNTQTSNKRSLDWWREKYGDFTLKQITPQLLADAQDELSKIEVKRRNPSSGELELVPMAASSVKRYMAAISGVLGKAQKKWHWISLNPALAVEKPKVDNARNRYLMEQPEDGQTDSELARLLEAVSISESPDLRLAVELALHTGGRKMEVLGLKWLDVDLNSGLIRFMTPKNKQPRSVSIPNHLVEQLRERKRIQQRIDTPLVFPNKPIDGNPIQPIDLKTAWTTARQRAGLKDFRWHDLRHTAASYLSMSGASLLEIAAVLGHQTLQMVQRYSHLSPEHVASATSRIAERIGQHGRKK